jgi:hypothetical protein
MSLRSILRSWFLERPLDDDFARLWRFLKANPFGVVVWLGAFLRLIVYRDGRAFWLDESSLWGNLAGKRIFDFSGPLAGDQLAPIGFMISERALMSIIGTSRYACRLIPLCCGIGSLFLFERLAQRVLSPRPALLALALFAFSDDLIYYSNELKPYSTDLAVGLAISLAAVSVGAELPSWRRCLGLAILVVLAPWFSFASTFMVAACGLALVVDAARSSRFRALAVWLAMGTAWLLSLAVSYRASAALLSPYTTMYIFWDFAFLPLWPLPLSLQRAEASAGIILEIFVTPLNLVAPFLPRIGVILPAVLWLLGMLRPERPSWKAWLVVVLPIGLAIIASALKRYPLHGRLILELAPSFFLLIADGTEAVRARDPTRQKLVYKAVLILLLFYPCLVGVKNSISVPLRDFNRHGDLRRNLFMASDPSRSIPANVLSQLRFGVERAIDGIDAIQARSASECVSGGQLRLTHSLARRASNCPNRKIKL